MTVLLAIVGYVGFMFLVAGLCGFNDRRVRQPAYRGAGTRDREQV